MLKNAVETTLETNHHPRRRMYPSTPLREYRLRAGLTLAEVAFRAGLSLSRASYVERDPEIARSGEAAALLQAIDELCREREHARTA